jgi:GTP-binding protein
LDTGSEVAFCGRSNAGKSSAINTLTDQQKLARTSKTPGRTQLINFFSVTDSIRLVDLPGYGYAKVPDAVKRDWHKNIDDYLQGRQSLKGLVLVMDIRHPLREFDQMMLDWSSDAGVPVHILLTKADKFKRGAQQAAMFTVKKSIPDSVTLQTFSSTSGLGKKTLLQHVSSWLDI